MTSTRWVAASWNSPSSSDKDGGYVKSPRWVNIVQRVQTRHNPDPYDATPVFQGITVTYGAFSFGGVSFGFVEDRKHKYGPNPVGPDGQPLPVDQLPLLGQRQEDFLVAWRAMHPGQPKVLLTQTNFAVIETKVVAARAETRTRTPTRWPATGP